MKIKIEYTAHLNLQGIKNKSDVTLDNSVSISQFLSNHGINPHQQKFITPIVNQQQVTGAYLLQDQDDLFLYLPVGGG